MASGFTVKLLVLLLVSASTRANASRPDEHNDLYSLAGFSESAEDEGPQDLAQALERLLRKGQATCRHTWQCDHKADRSARDQDIRTSEINFESYGENEEESPSNRLEDSGSPRLQPNIEIGHIRRSPFDDFRRSQRSEQKAGKDDRSGKGQIKRNNLDGFITKKPDNDGEGQMKRMNFDGFVTRDPNNDGRRQMTIHECDKPRPANSTPSNDCTGQLKRNLFDRFVTRDPSNDVRGQMKRHYCDDPKEKENNNDCKGQLKRYLFDSFKRSRSNQNPTGKRAGQIQKRNNYFKTQQYKQNYGDMGTVQTEGNQADRNLPPIQRSNFDDLESESIQSREVGSEQVEIEGNDYNYDQQMMRDKYADGQEIRQVYDDQPQNFQRSELSRSPPSLAFTSNKLSGYGVDSGIPQKKLLEVHSNADGDKEPSTAEETSPDELLALLVKLIRDKRQKEPQ